MPQLLMDRVWGKGGGGGGGSQGFPSHGARFWSGAVRLLHHLRRVRGSEKQGQTSRVCTSHRGGGANFAKDSALPQLNSGNQRLLVPTAPEEYFFETGCFEHIDHFAVHCHSCCDSSASLCRGAATLPPSPAHPQAPPPPPRLRQHAGGLVAAGQGPAAPPFGISS